MNDRSKSFKGGLVLAALLASVLVACGAGNEDAPAPPPPPVDPAAFNGTTRPPAPNVVIAAQDLSDAGDLQHTGAAGAASAASSAPPPPSSPPAAPSSKPAPKH